MLHAGMRTGRGRGGSVLERGSRGQAERGGWAYTVPRERSRRIDRPIKKAEGHSNPVDASFHTANDDYSLRRRTRLAGLRGMERPQSRSSIGGRLDR